MPGSADTFGDDNLLAGNPRYRKIRALSRGAFGEVVLGQDMQTGEQVALKFIERGAENINKYVEREIVNHMRLRHPHIIALREVFLTPSHLVLAMEYAAGGDLFHFVAARHGLPEEEARWFFQQLMIALDYCHRMGVTSRDIKLENTLLDGSDRPLIKLADFGFSKDANQHSAPTSRVGTPAYLAPEVVGNRPGQVYDGKKADIWSCGVLLFIMVTDAYPFRRQGDDFLKPNQRLNAMLQRVLRADYAFPPTKQLSEEVRDLISRILVSEPTLRASLQDILTHPWFTKGLNPAALNFNNTIIEESLVSQPPAEVLAEVRQIVQQAAREEARDASGQPERPGSGSGHTAGTGSFLDEMGLASSQLPFGSQ
ncbi:sulfur stress regulator [Micractinium conductrix]|uniref:Sulfur stress regulator n=1 Tax=Micractinium conductrix TaxID=554055 RepID=A0A2P6VK50_9CHLO|nr:sulfur stress regulator [Micractinium conductrix]|eukprot:PSC74454.1 sulfur stress regulator [Micractinium conductrix]